MKRRKTGKAAHAQRSRRNKGVAPAHQRRRPVAKPKIDFIDLLVAATAQALGLIIDPAWRDGVRFNFRLALDHAARVEEFPLSADAEPAPVFHA
jgi:hypothetical protein